MEAKRAMKASVLPFDSNVCSSKNLPGGRSRQFPIDLPGQGKKAEMLILAKELR